MKKKLLIFTLGLMLVGCGTKDSSNAVPETSVPSQEIQETSDEMEVSLSEETDTEQPATDHEEAADTDTAYEEEEEVLEGDNVTTQPFEDEDENEYNLGGEFSISEAQKINWQNTFIPEGQNDISVSTHCYLNSVGKYETIIGITNTSDKDIMFDADAVYSLCEDGSVAGEENSCVDCYAIQPTDTYILIVNCEEGKIPSGEIRFDNLIVKAPLYDRTSVPYTCSWKGYKHGDTLTLRYDLIPSRENIHNFVEVTAFALDKDGNIVEEYFDILEGNNDEWEHINPETYTFIEKEDVWSDSIENTDITDVAMFINISD